MGRGDVVRTRTIKAVPPSRAWNLDLVRGIKGTPWAPEPSKTDLEREDEEREEELEHTAPPAERTEEEIEHELRGTQATRKLLMRFGVSPQCPGCRAYERGAPRQGHTEACRIRIENSLIASDVHERNRI